MKKLIKILIIIIFTKPNFIFSNSLNYLRKLLYSSRFNLAESKNILKNIKFKNRNDGERLLIDIVNLSLCNKEKEKDFAKLIPEIISKKNIFNNEKKDTKALHFSVKNDLVEIVKILASYQEIVLQKNKQNQNALHLLSDGPNHKLICYTLVNAGVDINEPDQHGNRPIHLVPANCVKTINDFGADINLKNSEEILNKAREPITQDQNEIYYFNGLTPIMKAAFGLNREKEFALIACGAKFYPNELELLKKLARLNSNQKKLGDLD